MDTYYEFDLAAIDSALEAVSLHNEVAGVAKPGASIDLSGGEYSVRAQCITVTVQNHKLCFNLPLGIGKFCVPVPKIIPDGTKGDACIDICTKWGIPTGVKVTVSVLGKQIFAKTWGVC